MKSLLSAALVFVSLLVVAGCAPMPAPPPAAPTPVPPTPAPDLSAPVKAWVGAINKGDVDAALALLADNITWMGTYDATDKERLRQIFDSLVGGETKFQVKDCQLRDDRMVCTLSVVDGCIAAFGAADGLTDQLVFIYQPDGKVRQGTLSTTDPRDPDYTNFLLASMAWASKDHAKELARVHDTSKEGGAAAVKLCQEYAETLKASPTPSAALMDVVKAYEAAVNRDDGSGFPTLFPEQFVYGWFEASMLDQKQLADVTAFWAAMHDGMRLTECWQSQENQVKCSATYWDDCYKAAGAPAITISLGFTIIDNKIKLLSFQVPESSQADVDKVDAFMINAALWMRQQHPALQDKVRDSKGEYIMSSEAGATRSQICKEYAETLK